MAAARGVNCRGYWGSVENEHTTSGPLFCVFPPRLGPAWLKGAQECCTRGPAWFPLCCRADVLEEAEQQRRPAFAAATASSRVLEEPAVEASAHSLQLRACIFLLTAIQSVNFSAWVMHTHRPFAECPCHLRVREPADKGHCAAQQRPCTLCCEQVMSPVEEPRYDFEQQHHHSAEQPQQQQPVFGGLFAGAASPRQSGLQTWQERGAAAASAVAAASVAAAERWQRAREEEAAVKRRQAEEAAERARQEQERAAAAAAAEAAAQEAARLVQLKAEEEAYLKTPQGAAAAAQRRLEEAQRTALAAAAEAEAAALTGARQVRGCLVGARLFGPRGSWCRAWRRLALLIPSPPSWLSPFLTSPAERREATAAGSNALTSSCQHQLRISR